VSAATPPTRPVFSTWAWLALAPYLLTALAGVETADGPSEFWPGVLAALAVHAALLPAFLLVGFLERRSARHAGLRWSIVGAALLGLAVGRPALLSLLQETLGDDLVETPFILRVLMNLLVMTTALLLIYGVIEALQRSREAGARLRAVLEALASGGARLTRTRATVSRAFQRELARDVLDALGALIHRDCTPEVLAKELRWIARAVVQRAAEQARTAGLSEALEDTGSIPTVPAAGPAKAGALPPIAAGGAATISLITAFLYLAPALSNYEPLVGLLLVGVSTVVALVLTATIRRLPLPHRPGPALWLLGGLYLLTGTVCCGLLVAAAPIGGLRPLYLVYGTIGFTLVGVFVSLLASSLRELRANEQAAADAILEGERRRFEAQRQLVADASATGRLLDVDIQGDILATSFRLEAGQATPDVLDELIDRIEAVLRGAVATTDFAPILREGLRSTLSAWGEVLEVRTEVEDAALDWLAAHPGSAAIAHDAITEGLTNAVRYGRDASAVIGGRCVGDTVEISVRNAGRMGPRDGAGTGLRDLESRARSVELREVGPDVELRVVIGG